MSSSEQASEPEPLPQWQSSTKSSPGRSHVRRHGFFQPFNNIPGMGILTFSAFLVGLICYTAFLSPQQSPLVLSPSESYGFSQPYTSPTPHLRSTASTPANHTSSSPTSDEPDEARPPFPDVLSLEQIRDIVGTTRGFFARYYSLDLGWNNMQYILEASLHQASLLNRTLIIPTYVYARACEYHIETCAEYAAMVNRGDAVGSDQWRDLPIEKQMAFRLPISVMIDLPHLRARYPVITVSEYLRLHGIDPEVEFESHGSWLRDTYHTNPNIFESNKTKTPSLFVIENHWYEPWGSVLVDYIPQAMKERGNWVPYSLSQSQETGGYWRFAVPTNISKGLANSIVKDEWDPDIMDWDAAKEFLLSSKLGPEVDLDDDKAVEDFLNANGWEVLYTFASVPNGAELLQTITTSIRQVAPRSSIRSFKDDFYRMDADVVLLEGEVHSRRKPGAMRFTEDIERSKYASLAVHALIQPQPILTLAETLAARMRKLNNGRLWMGTHMRRGDFLRIGWVMEWRIEDHVERIKNRLEKGRRVLSTLEHLTTYDIENVEPDMDQIALHPPRPGDRFYVATDERDPDALRVIQDGGGVFLSDLLEMEDRRTVGWPLMLTDVRALVERLVLSHSAYFYGHMLSSYSGRVVNMRAARGADRRTAFID